MALSMSRVITCGALAPVTSTAPITRSADATSRATTSSYGYSAVTLLPSGIISSMRSWRISNTTTFAPPAAASAADVAARLAGAEHDDLAALGRRQAAEQLALAAFGLVQQVRADLHARSCRR